MRKIVLAFVTALLTALTMPAKAQHWSPALTSFTQGQTYTLSFEQPGSPFFETATLWISYLDDVFLPLGLLTSDPHTPSQLSVTSSITGPAGGIKTATLLFEPSAVPLPLNVAVGAGSLFGAQFQVKPGAPLGVTDVLVEYEISLANGLVPLGELTGSANFTANIVAVPEPGTWAMMIAGLGLVGCAAARARRNRA